MAYFTPTVLPMIAVANIWLFFYTPQYGLLEQVRGALGLDAHNWLGDPSGPGLHHAGGRVEGGRLFMIFYLAALQTLNPSLKEAAVIEGASRWYFLRRVQWPLLMPTTLFILVNAVINAFRLVDHVFILTRGGPDNASTLLLYHLYEVGFKFWDTGYAAAITVVLVVVLAAVALFQFFVLDKKVHYQ
jgi:sn-glycerol 3-phosphate transport system permease protein